MVISNEWFGLFFFELQKWMDWSLLLLNHYLRGARRGGQSFSFPARSIHCVSLSPPRTTRVEWRGNPVSGFLFSRFPVFPFFILALQVSQFPFYFASIPFCCDSRLASP